MQQINGIRLWERAERRDNNIQRIIPLLQSLDVSLQRTFSAVVAVLVIEALCTINSNTC
jgi:hypothetical protein